MKIAKLKNPVCPQCHLYLVEGNYRWMCCDCRTVYQAKKYKKGSHEYFEYEPSGEMITPDTPMGVSQWRAAGQKYGYDKYFKITW